MNAELFMLIGGVFSFVLTLHWVRSRDLREKYAVGWLGLAVILLFCGLFPRLLMSMADASRLSYPAAVLFVALTFVYGFSFSVSVSMTRQHRTTNRLLQKVALLEERLARVEVGDRSAGNRVSETAKVASETPDLVER